VEEALAVLARLERIEALERDGVSRAELLAELRLLVREAEAWSRAEGGDAGERAVGELRSALTAVPSGACPELSGRDMIAV
jgi:hypothetical protein